MRILALAGAVLGAWVPASARADESTTDTAAVAPALDALAPEELIDRVVAVVDREVITASELLAESRVQLVWRGTVKAALAEPTQAWLDELLDFVVTQTVVAAQARRLGGTDVSDDALAQRLYQFKQRFGAGLTYGMFLRRAGLRDTMVQDILRRDLHSERYIAQRLRSRMLARGGETTEDRAQIAVWVKELRQGAEIRRLDADGALQTVDRSEQPSTP